MWSRPTASCDTKTGKSVAHFGNQSRRDREETLISTPFHTLLASCTRATGVHVQEQQQTRANGKSNPDPHPCLPCAMPPMRMHRATHMHKAQPTGCAPSARRGGCAQDALDRTRMLRMPHRVRRTSITLVTTSKASTIIQSSSARLMPPGLRSPPSPQAPSPCF